ncbi:chemoreceptor glutamine deamidase CheD, partial [Rhizobium leguminosarum]|nr:chemoreceptor glutamine deamidase CheD [Rhizobium leguminosarum]
MTQHRPGSPFASGASASTPAFDGVERRQAPRIAPLSADVYSSAPAGAAKQSTLQELKGRTRRPGEASFFFFDHHFQHNAVKVLPGEYFVSDENLVIMTVLGSCIAACLWD